jgi:hypothetical protein
MYLGIASSGKCVWVRPGLQLQPGASLFQLLVSDFIGNGLSLIQ